MLSVVEDMDAVDTAIKRWLDNADPNLVAFQPSDNKDVKQPHIIFHLISLPTDDYSCTEYTTDEDGNPQACTTLQHTLTYQLDVLHCPYGFNVLLKLLRDFKSGAIRQYGSYENLSFSEAGIARRIHYYRHKALHWKATIDLDFIVRFHNCVTMNTMETINISACVDAPDLPTVNVVKP